MDKNALVENGSKTLLSGMVTLADVEKSCRVNEYRDRLEATKENSVHLAVALATEEFVLTRLVSRSSEDRGVLQSHNSLTIEEMDLVRVFFAD